MIDRNPLDQMNAVLATAKELRIQADLVLEPMTSLRLESEFADRRSGTWQRHPPSNALKDKFRVALSEQLINEAEIHEKEAHALRSKVIQWADNLKAEMGQEIARHNKHEE